MSRNNGTTVSLTTGWNDWHWANAPLAALRDVHWRQPAGAPRPIVHAYISCSAVTDGELSHRCAAASRPHDVLVCVLRRHNLPAAYTALARQADLARVLR